MKNRSKILLALLIVLTLMVGVFAITANAADSTTVYLDNDAGWSNVYCYYWNASSNNGWPGGLMSYDDDLGYYYFDIPSGYTMCIFNNGSGTQTADLAVPTGEYVIFNNSSNKWFNSNGVADVPPYTVAGSNSSNEASIFGTAWDTTNTANDMTYDASTNTYVKVYEGVPSGSYKFKCVQDHSWTVAYGGSWDGDGNYGCTVSTAGSRLTITLKGSTISTKVEAPTAKVGSKYYYDGQAAIDALEANGGTLTLYKNISITEAMNFAGKSAVINLNGKTLTIGAGDNKFVDETNLTIKNGIVDITGVTVKGNAIFCLDEYEKTLVTTLTLENVDLVGNGYSSAYGIFYIGASSVLNVEDGEWNLANDTHASGGVFKADSAAATLNISGLTLAAHNVRRLATWADTTVEGSTITVTGDADGVDAEMEHGFNRCPLVISDSTITIKDIVGRAITAEGGDVNINNSTVTITNAQEATIKINKNQTVTVDVKSTVTADGKDVVASNSSISYVINDLDNLKAFRDNVNAGNTYKGLTVKLGADIDLGSEEWTPIGNSTTNFQGIFDGDDHVIFNLVITGNNSNVGFFGVTSNGEIKNLTINNAKVSGYLNVGVVAATPYTSKYTNITVSGHVEVNGFAYVGGVGGKNAYANWTDITVNVDDTSLVKGTSSVYDPDSEYADEDGYVRYRTYVGGVVGFNGEGGHTFTNISSNIKVIGNVRDIGGLFGIAHYGNKFVNVEFAGSVEAPEGAKEVGGIAGVWHNEVGQTVTFTDVTSTGTVTVGETTTTGSVVGGAYKPNNEAASNSGSLVIDGKEAWVAVARIGENRYQTLAEAFKAAKNGEEVVIVEAGTYKLGVSGKSITVTGAVDGVVFEGMGAYNMGSASVTFNNVTFNWTNENYTGLQHSGDLVYNNCTINGQPFLYGTSETFNECTFNQESSGAYNVWTYGAKKVTFNKCTFNSAGKSVLVYTEAAEHFIDLAVTETTFNASSTVDGKAAIEIDTSMSAGANISVDAATTATGFDEGSVSGNTLYNNKKGNEGVNNDVTVTVDNTPVLDVIKTAEVNGVYYTTIAAALDAAKDGDTVYIYAGEYTQSISVNKAITVIGETDADGNNLVKLNGGISITKDGAIVKNITASNPSTTGYNMTLSISGKDILVEGCVITDHNGVRYASASGLVTFKNCVITGDVYGIHFDGKAGGEIVIEGCTITGWTSFASTIKKVAIKETTFASGDYNYVRFYQEEIVLEGCTFNEEMVVDIASSAAGASVTVNDCTVENGTIVDLFEESDLKSCEVVVDEDRLYPIVAKVNGEDFRGASIQDAIKAAAPNGTVDIIEDVVIDKWIMFAQNLTIGNGSLITLDMSGLTINGNGHKLTVNSIESAKNGNRLFYGANELHINDWTIEIAEGVNGGVSLASGSLNNVHFIGGVNQVLTGSGNITISGCTFEKSVGHAIYTDENSGNLAIDGCKFMENGSGYAVVLRTAESSFTNNICSVKLNLYADGVAENVTGNTFDSRVKLYTSGETLSGNVFTENGYVAVNSSDLLDIDVSGNYWGGENPVNLPANVICDSYYTSINEDGTLGDCVEVVVYVIDADGSLSHYGDIQAALDAAVDGDVVVVNSDLVLSGAVVVDGKDITLNLNGKTLSLAGEVATYSLDSVGTVIAAIDGANLKIGGNGNVFANADGSIFYEDEDSNIEIVSGNFHGVDSIDAYLAAGFRAVELEDAEGNVYFGVAANDATVYIGTNGNWWVGDYDTGVGAHPVVTIQMVTDRPGYEPGYYWFINGKFSGEAYAVDGINPTIFIGEDGYWYVDFDGEGVRNPVKGESAVAVDGYSVTGIAKDAKDEENSVDNIDVYIITYSNGVDERTSKFIIVNGIDGQQGERGDKGEQGVQGVPGDKGDPGTNGNSNTWLVEIVVISSVVCILVAVGVVLVLNKKRLSWWA